MLLDHEVHLTRSFIFIFHILILSPYQSLAYPTPIALRTKAECHWSIFRAIQSFILKNKTIKTLSHASLLIFRNKHFDSQWQSSSYCKKRQKSGKLMPISSLPHKDSTQNPNSYSIFLCQIDVPHNFYSTMIQLYIYFGHLRPIRQHIVIWWY